MKTVAFTLLLQLPGGVYFFLSTFSRGRRLPGECSLCSFSRAPDYLEEDAGASYTNPFLKIK